MTAPTSSDVYRVKMFERGYTRRQCSKCKAYFWSIKERSDCGDAPCTHYTFFEIPVKRSLSYREVRDVFLRFFEKHGHTIVEPRPVVARWREDLYLTIASIVVFQPHVTSGVVPPPANPLVIAQPCIRLEDIDVVGLTFGRHLTNFIMGGHHAFNYPDKYVYWKDETVELAKQFFVEEIGVPEEELCFKESWWEGGGNAGPCFEVSVGGLEVATLVFMMYRVVDGKYEEIPLKIVDTGYGIERIAWLTQKTPTAFHAVYGSLVDEFRRVLGLSEPPKDLLFEAAKRSALYKFTEAEALDRFFDDLSASLGMDRREIEEMLRKEFDLYALLDHTKTIALMLGDGVVPSNSGEGYLARLVIRRAMRRLHRLAKDVPLRDLVIKQVDYWYVMYPQLAKAKSYIAEVLELEEERYREVLKRVSSVASKYVSKPPTIEDLVKLYDSQGIPPEILADELSKRGVKIVVPPNFYSIVASKHSAPPTIKGGEKRKLEKDVESWASKLPQTKFLFHEDPYLREFEARVVGVYGKYVALDRTAFYPEGGGQLGDRGYLIIDGKRIRVVDTQKVGNVVVHILETEDHGIVEGATVRGVIDWSTRYRRMKHHTATHILLGALRKVLGEHVWQAGAEKTEFKGRLDVTHYKLPDTETVRKIEALVNQIIEEGRPVYTHYLPKNLAEEKYGFVLYQGGVPMEPTIRVVEIPGWDAQACFGTHVRNTAEVGGFKIVNVEKIADGVIRFEYVASTAMVDYVANFIESIDRAAKLVGADIPSLEQKLRSLVSEREELKKMVKSYREAVARAIIENFDKIAQRVGNYLVYVHRHAVQDIEGLRDLLRELSSKHSNAVIVGLMPRDSRTYIEISLGRDAAVLDARKIVEALSKELKVRAGGKQDHVTGIVEGSIDDVYEKIKSLVLRVVEQG